MGILDHLKSALHKGAAPAPAEAGEDSGSSERRRRKRLNHKGRRILIIDDSPTIVATLGKMLRSAGCRISEAADAEQGLELVRQEVPELVFLDIVLPGMNGFAALRTMRRAPATQAIPVIMISGNEQATEQFYAKRIGADDFMKKPFSRHEVFARMEKLIEAGKLGSLDTAHASQAPQVTAIATPASPGSQAASASRRRPLAPIATSLPPARPSAPPSLQSLAPTATLANEVVARMTQLEARSHLTAMGLQYFNQEQFNAAISRGDQLAVDLFIIGGGVEIRS